MNKKHTIFAALVVAGVLWAATPSTLGFDPVEPLPPGDVIPGTEERRVRYGGAESTEWVVLWVHGFSATRQSTAPLAQTVADSLQANLLEVRLSGHGLASNALEGVRAEHWLADGERALRDAASMGNRIVAIGSSTGATLLTAMLETDLADRVDTVVMLSPNFAPADAKSEWVLAPGGRLLAWLVEGFESCWEPRNELQAKYWSTCYPVAAAVEVMRLVELARRVGASELEQDVLVFYSPDDMVVSPQAILTAYEALDVPRKQLIEVNDADDTSNHVLAGDILSPSTTDRIAGEIVAFTRRQAP